MDKNTTLEVFRNQILKKNNLDKAIGNVIVNQKIISGLGKRMTHTFKVKKGNYLIIQSGISNY
jgi:hypothetical protein